MDADGPQDEDDPSRGRTDRLVGRAAVQEVDPAAIRAAAAGDVDAFEQLVRTFQAPVWRFLRELVDDPHLAEDLTQETFVRAFTKLPTYAFRARFSTWLFQVARNVAIDALRSAGRRKRLVQRVSPAVDEPGPEEGNELRTALQSLPHKLREALLLVEVVGLSCAEAARVLEVPEGTVKSRLFHARKRLVAWFGEGEGHTHAL